MMFGWLYGLTVVLPGVVMAACSLFSGGSLMSGLLFSLILLASERLTGLTAYGSRADSRLWFIGIFLALSPVFIASKLSEIHFWGILLVVCALYAVLKITDTGESRWVLLLLPAGIAALVLDIRLAGLLLPVVLQLALTNTGRKDMWSIFMLFLPVIIFTTVTVLSKNMQELIMSWNLSGFAGFSRLPAIKEEIPGFLYVIYPLAHPWFCMLLPGLFLMFRKTDWVNPARRMLISGAVVYLLLLGGLTDRTVTPLVPAYIILLTVIFPSWDRIYCYGLYFFRKTVWMTIGLLIIVQVAIAVYSIENSEIFSVLRH